MSARSLLLLLSLCCWPVINLSAQILPVKETAQAARPAEQESAVHQAAQHDFALFVSQQLHASPDVIPDGFPLAISSMASLAQAQIAYGFPVYSIDPNLLLTRTDDLSDLMSPTGAWRYVIELNQQPIGMATLEMLNGRWRVVAYGAVKLAQNLASVRARYSNDTGNNLQFLRVFQAHSDFMVVSSDSGGGSGGGEVLFIPLTSAQLALPQLAASDGPKHSADLIEPLRAAVRRNLADFANSQE